MPHPLDVNYESLKATLTHVKEEEEEFSIIERYLTATEPSWRNVKILDIFRVDREGEVRGFPRLGNNVILFLMCRGRGLALTTHWRIVGCSGMALTWLWLLPSSSQD